MKAYTGEQKKKIINRYLNGESVSSLSKSSYIARSTIYLWIDEYNKTSNLCKEMNLLDIHRLRQKCDRQEKMLDIIRISSCSPNSTQTEKYEAITALSDRYNVNTLCKALGMAKGSYYNHILRNKNGNTLAAQRNAELKDAIEKIYNDSHQIFGVGKIVALLRTQGYNTSKTTVGKIMHKNGWFSIRRSAKTLYLQERQKKKNVLNQEFHATRPNEIWVSDVTYFPIEGKGYNICAIMDLYARKIVACEISLNNSTHFTKRTFNQAYETRKPTLPLLFHSDRGCNYTAKGFVDHLKNLGVKQSFSRKATPYDNSVMESFFSSMKQEELYRTRFKSEREFKNTVFKYITFYNSKRPHSTLHYLTPDQIESSYYTKIQSDTYGS